MKWKAAAAAATLLHTVNLLFLQVHFGSNAEIVRLVFNPILHEVSVSRQLQLVDTLKNMP